MKILILPSRQIEMFAKGLIHDFGQKCSNFSFFVFVGKKLRKDVW